MGKKNASLILYICRSRRLFERLLRTKRISDKTFVKQKYKQQNKQIKSQHTDKLTIFVFGFITCR